MQAAENRTRPHARAGLTLSERGRLHVILRQLEERWEELGRRDQEHVSALLELLARRFAALDR